MTTTWNETIFAGIRRVNQCLYSSQHPEKAEAMLYMMEDCLCSGDGLSPKTTFRAKNEKVVDGDVKGEMNKPSISLYSF